jgi:hypothetical protein
MPYERGAGKSASEVPQNSLPPGEVHQDLLNTRIINDPLRAGLAGEGEGVVFTEKERTQWAHALYLRDRQECQDTSLPLEWYFRFALEEVLAGRDRRPRWHSALFDLVRLVKAHPEMEERDAHYALQRIEAIMRSWPEARGTHDVWKRCADVWAADARAEFYDCWPKIRCLPGRGPLGNAWRRATENPLTLPPEVRRRRGEEFSDFVSLAGWLQVVVGAQPILLPVEEVGKHLGVQAGTVSRYRRWAVEEGFLREVARAEFKGPGKRGKATEFLFDVARYPELIAAAQTGTADLFAGKMGATALEHFARSVVDHYQKIVAPQTPPGGAVMAVLELLKAGRTVEELCRCVDRYAAFCRKMRLTHQFREAAKTFYGDAGSFASFLAE